MRDRTVFLAGSFSSVTQSLMSGLTALGADVALAGPAVSVAERFCTNLTDQREVKPKHGRAIAITSDLTKASEIKDALGKVATSLGGIDVFIDAQMLSEASPFELTDFESELQKLVTGGLTSTLLITQQMIAYLKGRKKGRIVYLLSDSMFRQIPQDIWGTAIRSGLVEFASNLAKQLQDYNISVNAVSVGMSEEYLLAHYPGIAIKEALEKHKVLDPFVRLTEPERLSNAIVYLVSQMGGSESGQLLRMS